MGRSPVTDKLKHFAPKDTATCVILTANSSYPRCTLESASMPNLRRLRRISSPPHSDSCLTGRSHCVALFDRQAAAPQLQRQFQQQLQQQSQPPSPYISSRLRQPLPRRTQNTERTQSHSRTLMCRSAGPAAQPLHHPSPGRIQNTERPQSHFRTLCVPRHPAAFHPPGRTPLHTGPEP
jgi:hypothetical protein